MDKRLRWIAFGSAFVGMGMSMPSCPGQQAMQQQLDAEQAQTTKLQQLVTAMDARLKNIEKDVGDSKGRMEQVVGAVNAQTEAVQRLDQNVKANSDAVAALQASRSSGKPAGKAAARPAARGKKR